MKTLGTPPTQTRRRLALRTRIVLAMSALSLALSVGLATATYFTVRLALLDEREAGAIDQALVNGRVINDALPSGINVSELLASLRPPERSQPIVLRAGEWFTTSLGVGPEDLPDALRDEIAARRAAVQRFRARGQPMLAVGLPLGAAPDSYFEVVSLADLDGTLSTLAWALLVFGCVTTASGGVVGWRVSDRLLRPLRELSGVAEAIADGALDSRVEATADEDLARLTASFNRMAASLQDRILREARFASDVSHELRSPLTTLSNSLEVLERRRHELSPAGQEGLGLLGAEIGRFVRTVTELLEISRYDAGGVEPELEPVEVVPFVIHAAAMLGHGDVPVDADGDVRGAVVDADRRRLERVLANLFENATLHAGGVRRVVVERQEGRVRLAVEDRGRGVPVEDRERIFERFARGSRTSRHSGSTGTGLGLALVREHTRVQDGRVWVEDGPAGGARFVVELPEAEP